MTTNCPFPNSGYTAHIPFHHVNTAGGATLTVPLSLKTKPVLCCSYLTTTGFLMNIWNSKQHLSHSIHRFCNFFFHKRKSTCSNFYKTYRNKDQNVLLLLSGIHCISYMTGQYFNRFEDPNIPLLKQLLLFVTVHSGQKLTENLWKT